MAKIFKQTDRRAVGDVEQSMLTLAQFQAIKGTGWVLADGSSCVGTTYATITGASTVPDLRGLVLRGKNNGRVDGNQNPDGEVALGTYQADDFKSHAHSILRSSVLGQVANTVMGGGGNDYGTAAPTTGGNESRMKNATVNHFIKVNN